MEPAGIKTLITAVSEIEHNSIIEAMPIKRVQAGGWLWTVACVVLLTGTHAVLQLATPLYSVQVMDRFVPTNNLTTLLQLLFVVALVLSGDAVLEFCRITIISRLTTVFTAGTFLTLMHRRDTMHDGMSLLQEITNLRSLLSGPLGLGLLDLPAAALFTLVLFRVHTLLGLSCLLLMAATLMVGWINGSAAATTRRRATLLYGSLAVDERRRSTASRLTGFSRERFVATALNLIFGSGAIAEANGKSSTLSQSIRLIGQVGMITISGLLIARKEIGLESMVVSTLLFGRALSAVERCSDVPALNELLRAARKVMTEKEAIITDQHIRTNKVRPPDGSLAVCSVSAKYGSEGRLVLRDVTFSAAPGEITILVGDTASGKSTLLSLIAAEMKPSAGSIKMSGFDVHDVDREVVQARISYLPQRLALGLGSFADVIAGDRPFDADLVVEAAEMAGVHKLILATPGGYEQTWKVDDLPWSRGQQQQLALARAFYGSPNILVLDEPNTFLGESAESFLLNALIKLKSRNTNIIMVSRSSRLSALVDQTVYLQDGKVAGVFSRQEIEEHVRAKSRVNA